VVVDASPRTVSCIHTCDEVSVVTHLNECRDAMTDRSSTHLKQKTPDQAAYAIDSDEVDVEPADSLLRAVARASNVEPGPVEGDVIGGNFRIEGKLATGGMGVVYLARDVRLRRPIALKLHKTAEGASRSEREARVLARLVHPNVVTIHDVGIWRDRTYIAMEYLDGGTLRTWLGERRRTWREILAIFLQAGRGLEAAHRAGLVHRDFKPDNVLLGSDGRVRVADFGLARPLGAGSQERPGEPSAAAVVPAIDAVTEARLTASDARIGTPGYMAPEAERGDEVDARADQYSFCATLSAALDARDTPSWIRPILERGLHPDPGRRHPSLGAMLDALERRMRPRRRWIAPAILAVVGVAALSLWMTSRAGEDSSASLPACPAPELPALHVDAAAAPGGNGSTACPFRTLTRALAVPGDRRVVHVAAGRYDAEHGEQLPLLVRGPTEIRGAGGDVTVIAGLGYFDPRPDLIVASAVPLRATLVVGDDLADIVLSGISVRSSEHEITAGSAGILCTRGNLHRFEGPVPPPNTRLDRVIVGPDYELGLVVTGGSSPRLTGCNLSVTAGFFHDTSVGIWQVGCGMPQTGAAPTALEVGTSSFHPERLKPDADRSVSIGIMAWDCASRLRVSDSKFSDSDFGMEIIRHKVLQSDAARDPHEPPAIIERSEFGDLRRYGIFLDKAVNVELHDNVFHNNPTGIVIDPASDQPPYVRARHNGLWQNAIAVDIWARGNLPADSVIDFGRAGDPGNNGFSCNAVQDKPLGAAVVVKTRLAPGASVTFVGNQWDHVPPRVRRGFRKGDRAEVVFTAERGTLDVSDAGWTSTVCSKP
jgi:predicted Ser/Thr protein kinase